MQCSVEVERRAWDPDVQIWLYLLLAELPRKSDSAFWYLSVLLCKM